MLCNLNDLGHTKIFQCVDDEQVVSCAISAEEVQSLDVHEGIELLIEHLYKALGYAFAECDCHECECVCKCVCKCVKEVKADGDGSVHAETKEEAGEEAEEAPEEEVSSG